MRCPHFLLFPLCRLLDYPLFAQKFINLTIKWNSHSNIGENSPWISKLGLMIRFKSYWNAIKAHSCHNCPFSNSQSRRMSYIVIFAACYEKESAQQWVRLMNQSILYFSWLGLKFLTTKCSCRISTKNIRIRMACSMSFTNSKRVFDLSDLFSYFFII